VDHLGSGEQWHQIYALNAGLLQPDGERLVLPSLIQPGWILRLPAPAPATAPGNGHATGPPTPVAPEAGRSARPERAPSPSTQPSVHKTISLAPAPHHGQADAGNAVSIPWGGLTGAGLAGAVTGALALAAVQRRRRYQPARIITPSLEPGAPPPPLIGVLRRAAQPADTSEPCEGTSVPARGATQGDGLPPSAIGGTPTLLDAHPRAAAHPPGVISLGLRDGHEMTADIAALGGLGLTGPGADPAARALLLTILSQAQPGATTLPAEVFVPAADAATLIPGCELAGQPGLTVTGTLGAALDQMEAAVLTRARITATTDAFDPEAEEAALPPAGAAALIATPDPACSPRLAAILRMGSSTGVAAILLGDWPDGVTCHAEADGTVTAAVPPHPDFRGLRLFHLTPPDAASILSAFREAHGGSELHQQEEPAVAAHGQSVSGRAGPREVADAGDPATTTPDEGAASAPEPAGAQDSLGAQPAGDGCRPRHSARRLADTVAGREINGGLRKARELLAFLAVHPDGATGDQVSEALWPGAPPGHGTAQRNIAVRKLREMLRTATGQHEAMFITLTADRYRLDPALFEIDIWRLQRALLEARHASGEDAQLAACRDAYHGAFADGTGYDWAEPYAEQARRRALDAWTRIAEITAPRDPEQALAALETALGHDPYNEFVYQKIMRLQGAAGRPDAVRRTLSLLESRLTELGVTPARKPAAWPPRWSARLAIRPSATPPRQPREFALPETAARVEDGSVNRSIATVTVVEEYGRSMAAEPDLAARLAQAIKSYEGSWKPVDGELYELCARRSSHDSFADVYTKVAIIGRVYEAGLARAWRGEGDPETEVTLALSEQADLVRNGLKTLGGRSFDRQTAAEIVELHGHLARAISHRTKGVFLASFVSKYLHFHCPIVPIFDSNAQAAIGQLVDWELVSPIRDVMPSCLSGHGPTATSLPPSSSSTSGPTPRRAWSRASRNSTICSGSRADP